MLHCNHCGKTFTVETLHACEEKPMTLSSEQLDKLREMWENGCPTYDRSGIHLNENCWFCNEDIEYAPHRHLPSCPWLTLEAIIEQT